MKCGLVTLKAQEYKERYMKRHMVKTAAFGNIYFGYDSRSAQDVAIKECNREYMAKGKRRDTEASVPEDVEKEIELHKKVCSYESDAIHPGIIQIFDTCEDEVNRYLVMEWADRGDLFDYVDNHFQEAGSLSDQQVIYE